jgi:diguanylate cyclase (GGDEF)-like protein
MYIYRNQFDMQSLREDFAVLSSLTGLYYSMYDDKKNLLMGSLKQDALLTVVKANEDGQRLFNEFFAQHFEFTGVRKGPYMTQCLTGQYMIFMPVHCEKITLMVLAEAFYSSPEDFKKFYIDRGLEFNLKGNSLEAWIKKILIVPRETMENEIQHIYSLVEKLIICNNQKINSAKRLRWSSTIMSLLTDIKPDFSIRDIYQMIIDTVIFLFDAETASIFSRRNGSYSPEVSSGRNKNVVGKLSFSKNHEFILKAAASEKPLLIVDSHELWRTGFPEEINSMYLFPISYDLEFFAFLCIFGGLLDEEAVDLIRKFCKLAGHIYGARRLSDEYKKRFSLLSEANIMTSQFLAEFKDPERLYDSIINGAARLANAEKCSLMLPEKGMLTVYSSKGVNSLLMSTVRVGRGNGIAGKVFEEGVPIIIDNAETLKKYIISPRPLYKTFSCISLPLKLGDEIIGILNLSDKYSGQPFSEDDLFMLNMFASQASTFLKLYSCYKTSEEMRKLSLIDALTGVFNRRYFDIRLKEEFERAKRYGLLFSLAIMDVDDFKLFNDTEGHLAGDRILIEIASIVSTIIRVNDSFVRFGGEEFAVIIPQTSKSETFRIADRIRQKIKIQISGQWKNFPRRQITVSIGVATYPDCGEPIENLIRCADRALYKAKMLGKDQTVLFE